MTCLALDDEPLALHLLETYVQQLPMLSAQGFFNNPDEARDRLASGDIDLLFLDIRMPDITGLQFLQQIDHPPMVIFTTAFAEFAVEGFNLDAVDYLLKPFDFQRFEKAVYKAAEYAKFLDRQQRTTEPNLQTALFVKSGYSMVQIQFDDIRFIEGLDDYIKIYAGANKPVLTLMPLKAVLALLPENRFLRVHRSFIVATDKIESIRARKIKVGDRDIPVGDTYAPVLKDRLV